VSFKAKNENLLQIFENIEVPPKISSK